jgi:hypothetical protein
MSLLSPNDPFQITTGGASISIGAPHHGTRANVDADMGTGPIAWALAQRLNARSIIVSDLRRSVDVNKNPLRFDGNKRQSAQRYQNEIFSNLPSLIAEIHGHISGQYAIEITTGFELDRSAIGDVRFLEKLAALKDSLTTILPGKIGQSPTIGVWPIDRDVKKTATDTFTFQKIRRARNLVGAEWYGLHIELNAELRTSRQAKTKAFIEALADAFASSIRSAFDPLPDQFASIPTHADRSDGSSGILLSPKMLTVSLAPEKYVNANIVVVNPIDLEALGALDGDVVIIRHAAEELRSIVTPSLTVRAGHAALPARVRRQISVSERGRVTVGRVSMLNEAASPNHAPHTLVQEVRSIEGKKIWLAPSEIGRLGLKIDQRFTVQSQPGGFIVNAALIEIDPNVPLRRAAVSRSIADQLSVTLGEVLTLQSVNE